MNPKIHQVWAAVTDLADGDHPDLSPRDRVLCSLASNLLEEAAVISAVGEDHEETRQFLDEILEAEVLV